MSIRRLSFYLSLAFLVVLVIGIPVKSQFIETQQTDTELISGRNVNMVSGTTLPGGDPWLQRQNEPSIAVSSRNPLHLLAGANDYRTVDVPFSEGELPGKVPTAMVGDAWLGVFKSYDGGESWTSTMLPGFPQDPSANPLKNYKTAADPVVRSGPNGLFYYSGIAFNRNTNLGVVFVARFIDNNNKEGGDTIEYIDTKIIASGTATKFLDKPWIAVDQPRVPFTNITIAGQTFPRHNVYIAYSSFSGTKVTLGDVMFVRSTNCGTTWGTPLKISTGSFAHQGATIAIKPVIGEVLVAWRRFAQTGKSPDQIYVAQSFSRGLNFQSPIKVADIPPFDQPTTDETQSLPGTYPGPAFRTNSYPTITVDKSGHVYLAWSQRGVGAGGGARIMLSKSYLGSNWTSPQPIDPNGLSFLGHQIMPSLSFAAGKLILVWYDQRNDVSGAQYGYNNWILDDLPYRHTMDVWAAEADPDTYPNLAWKFIQVSRYLYSVLREDNGDIIFDGSGNPIIFPAQFNCVNYPLFKGGHNPFIGDYIDVAASPEFVMDNWRNWVFNTESSNSPVFHVAWTDNRDVRPPLLPPYDWTNYEPPTSEQLAHYISPEHPSCSGSQGNAPGMRNQNIYTSRISWGIEAGSPTNDKPLDLDVGRAFVVFVKNNTGYLTSFRLTIAGQPAGGQASFLQFELLTTLDVNIAPYSTISRPVFISSSDVNASVNINIDEIDASGNIIAGGLKSSVSINADPSNPNVPIDEETHNPNIVNQANPNIVNWYVNPNIVNPNIVNPNIVNPNIVNPNIVNPNIVNPNIVNPNIVNPNIVNPNIVNPNIVNHDVPNPNIVNPNIVNPNIVNPNIADADPEALSITDVEWTVRNDGNATTSFTLKALAKKSPPAGVYAQLLVYRVHLTPAVAGAELSSSEGISACELRQEPHHELILNIVNPNIVNPNIVNPNIVNPNIVNASIENATFSVAPGEEVIVDLRVLDTGVASLSSTTFKALSSKSSLQALNVQDFIDSLGFAVTSQAVNSEDAAQGIETPPAAATMLVIGTSALPDGIVNTGYTATLQAYGGDGSYNWSLNSGELPTGLSIGAGGVISGTPTTAGTYYFIVRVDDGSGQFDTQQYSIYIDSNSTPDTLRILTTSLPNGVQGFWYGATLEAEGGVWPRTWSLASGALPAGLSLDSGGVISGTPTAEGIFSFTVRVTDKNGAAATQLLSISISASTSTYFNITGTVYDEYGYPLSDVVLRGLRNTPTTDTYGNYQDKVPAGWSGTAIPFKAEHSFTPAGRTYLVVGSDQTSQDYNMGVATYTLTVSKAGSGAGTVTSVPAGIDCGSDCSEVFESGTSVQLSAAWAPGSTFAGWSGNVPAGHETDNPLTITMDANKTLAATFDLAPVLVLDHFDIGPSPISTQIIDTPFPITITAKDSGENVVTTYSGTNTLSVNFYPYTNISPANVTLTNGVWQGNVTITAAQYGVVISTSGGGKSGQCSAFDVLYPGPYSTISGQITYNGSPFLTGANVDFSLFDYGASHRYPVPPSSYNPLDGTFSIPNVRSGTYDIYLRTDSDNPPNYLPYPGDYAGGSGQFVVSAAAPVTQNVAVYKIIHLTAPVDNNPPPAPGIPVPPPYPGYSAPVTFQWEAIPEATTYEIYVWLCQDDPYLILNDNYYHESGITGIQKNLILPISDPNQHYEFLLIAYNASAIVVGELNIVLTESGGGIHAFRGSYQFKVTAGATYTISGIVTVGGSPLEGVVMSGLPGDPTTNASGEYTATVDYGWSGTVTPSLDSYSFFPASTTYTNVTANQTADYTAALLTYTISGTVTIGGSPLAGVTMSGLPGDPTTNASGIYSATVDHGWSGTATPTKTGYTFTPVSEPYTNVTSNQTTDYTAASVVLASKLVFTESPNGGVGGAIWTVQPIVEVQDADGNRLTSDDSTVVTLAIENNPGNGSLSGPFSMTVTDGEASFAGLSLDKGGYSYTLKATSIPILDQRISEEFGIEGFSDTVNNMGNIRALHTATTLGTDKVLITGGWNGSTPLSSVDLYDPSAKTFTSLGNMTEARFGHTATSLFSGNILITGGGTSVASAIIFDPLTTNFSPAGNMNYARIRHRATLLQDGRVLITGNQDNYQNTAEIYDPVEGTFTLTGNMNNNRNTHTSTLLPNGKVLITGGYGLGGVVLSSAELYDPDTGEFTDIFGGMAGGDRANHQATLLDDGTVLITGGDNGSDISADIYNPAPSDGHPFGRFDYIRVLYTHVGHQAVLLRDGTVLLIGGNNYNNANEIYLPSTKTFRPTGPMSTYRLDGAAAVLPDGRVLITGGYIEEGVSGTGEVWNPIAPFPTHVISGTIIHNSAGVGGVLLEGLPGHPLTNYGGYYEGLVLDGWSGTVTPTKPGYTFNPLSRPYTDVTSDRSAQNYDTTGVPTYTISGTVTMGGSGLADVVMSGLPGNPLTNDDGFYTGTVTYGWSGTVTPTLANHHFTPPSQDYSDVTSSQTTNYTAVKVQYQLNVSKAGSGAGTVTSADGGINCGPTCSANYDYGTDVQLTAAWAPGSIFAGWTGDVPAGHESDNPLTITVNGNKNLTANFNLIPPLVITTTSIPDGIKVAAYDTTVQSAGGLPPVNWSISSGSLPPGLTLNSDTGKISEMPTVSGNFNFTVQAQDATPQTATQALSMTVADWLARYNGPGNSFDEVSAIAVDSFGNVYVTGYGYGSGTYDDYATIKYNNRGEVQWIARYNGPDNGPDRAQAIAVDSSGNVYVTGGSTNDLFSDCVTIKYNSAGVEEWVARYDGPAQETDTGFAIAVDSSGNVYVAGGTEYTDGDSDYVTIKYDSSGVMQWSARYNGPVLGDAGTAIAVDSWGNVHVTGWSSGMGTGVDYATVKYDSAGIQQWVARYNGPGNYVDLGRAIAVDSSGNVYVTGYSAGSGTGDDYATIKYDSAGVEQWVTRYNGPGNSSDQGNGIAVDSLGSVYVTGWSGGSGTSSDFATIKYDSSGAEQWVARFNGPGNDPDSGSAIALDSLGNIYVTGDSRGSGTLDDYATIRYTQSFPSTLIISTETLDNGYVGTSYAATIWAFGGSGSRTWSILSGGTLPPGMDLSAVTGIISGTPTTPGPYNFTVRVVDGGLTATKPLSITIGTFVGPPHQLAFSQQPGNTAVGATITPAVTVQIQDVAGNLVTTATDEVTLSLLNAGGAALSGTNPRAAVDGIATFDDLSIDEVGTGYKLRAKSGSLTEVNSSAFNITAGSLSSFSFNYIGPQVSGVAFSITITAVDSFGNTVTDYTGSNTLTIDNPWNTIYPTSTPQFTMGSWTGNVTINGIYKGPHQISTSGGGKTGSSNRFGVT